MRTLVIAKGELWLHDGNAAPRRVGSRFADEAVEREAQSRRNTGWKNTPREDAPQGVIPPSVLWGRRGQASPLAPPRFLYAVRGADADTLFYVMSVGSSVGLFRLHHAEQREVRLFHRTGFACLGMDYSTLDDRLVLARAHEDGTAHIEVYDLDGNCKGAVTSGDCVDAAPAYAPGHKGVLVFQSQGAARRPQSGHVAALGPAVINRLDYTTGKLDTLMEERRYDFLAPRLDAQGRLWFIRRPFEKGSGEVAASAIGDALLLPWRLLKAVFGYLNFFSQVYGKEPLRSAGGPRSRELDQDLGRLWLHGRMIELSKVQYDAQRGGGLVPGSWELVRRERDGSDSVVDRHVVSFDLAGEHGVVYSNGFEVLRLDEEGRRSVARVDLAEVVARA